MLGRPIRKCGAIISGDLVEDQPEMLEVMAKEFQQKMNGRGYILLGEMHIPQKPSYDVYLDEYHGIYGRFFYAGKRKARDFPQVTWTNLKEFFKYLGISRGTIPGFLSRMQES